MRVDIKKFLFIGLEKDRASFFKKAQEVGSVQFIDQSSSKTKELPIELDHMSQAIKVLRGLPTMEQEELEEFALADGLVHKILHFRDHIDKIHEELRQIDLEISRIEIFGDFSKEDLQYIHKEGKRNIQFFFSKHGALHLENLPDTLLYVGTAHELDYYVSISQEAMQYSKLIEMHFEHSLNELETKKERLLKDLHESETRLKGYAKYNKYLHHAIVDKLNSHHLELAKSTSQSAVDDTLFSVYGWVPTSKEKEIEAIVKDFHVYAEEVAIEPCDMVPTYLENQGVERLGEDLVHIYDTPSITDKDPSLWVLVSFALFFSFIVGDAGYGMLFLAVALYIRYKHRPTHRTGKRVLNLVTLLSAACIAWGVLTTSFFGITIAPNNPLRKISLVSWLAEKKVAYHMAAKDSFYDYWIKQFPDLKDAKTPDEFIEKAATRSKEGEVNYVLLNKVSDNIMMELAITIGVVHVILSLIRYLDRNKIGIGWILFIIGCYLYFPEYLGAVTMTNYLFGITPHEAAEGGIYLIFTGIGLAVLIAIFKHKLLGIFEIMTTIQIFSDVMSYLRLYALGLAGAIMMATINESAASLNFVLAAVLILVGHSINIVLAIMGGIIHGLRLNFLEFYHYSFEGGGKMFKPLHKLHVE